MVGLGQILEKGEIGSAQKTGDGSAVNTAANESPG